MTDPRDLAAASALPTVGEGCLARFDPEALSDEHGTEFVGAAELWRRLDPAAGADGLARPTGSASEPSPDAEATAR